MVGDENGIDAGDGCVRLVHLVYSAATGIEEHEAAAGFDKNGALKTVRIGGRACAQQGYFHWACLAAFLCQ